MTRKLLALVLLAAGVVLGGSDLQAQRSGNILSLNTHGGKYESGGFGMRLSTAMQLGGDIYSGRIVQTGSGPIIGNGIAHERTDSVFGVGFDWQTGTDSDTLSANFSLDLNSYTVDGIDNAGRSRFLFDATVFRFGVDFILNFYKSEEVEGNGRRERHGTGMSVFFGPNLSFLTGDLVDLNGFATIGMNVGVAFDYALNDEFQIAPSAWLEMNYHMSGDAQRDIFNATDTGLTGPTQSAALDGLVVRTHTLVPPFIFNIGGDIAWTPAFVDEDNNIQNSWRFTLGAFFNAPFGFNTFAAEVPGDPLESDGDGSTYLTISLGVAYLW